MSIFWYLVRPTKGVLVYETSLGMDYYVYREYSHTLRELRGESLQMVNPPWLQCTE